MIFQDTDVSRRDLVTLGALGALAAAVPAMAQEDKTKIDPAVRESNPVETKALEALFDSYQKAFSAHDIAGVLASFAPNAVILGTGPGEIWGGHEEIGEAFKNFFQAFDPGKQEFEPLFRAANIVGNAAWLIGMSRVKFTKGKEITEFGLNTSTIFEKINGKWAIRTLHFSNLVAPPAAAKA